MAQKRLTRDHIVLTSIAFVDEHGLDALTMRRLGDVLGVEAMSLYRHVSGRGDLLEGMVANLIDNLFENELMIETPTSWEDYLQRVANATLQLAREHPEIFPLIATQPSQAPWLRPPLRSLRWVEDFLSTLQRFGFSDQNAVSAYKAFTSFLVGDLLLQVHSTGVDDVIGFDGDEAANEEADLSGYPTVIRLSELLGHDHSQREFDDALDDLIERIRTTLTK
ncbi:TetR/AcrR family transcriptional regulator [Brevibacterium marinum]|uniref:AcrR family transcriptional regulator n=1 Tax=Brevibacterium marinum TaxID=418643 RepID=A0A846RT64_9MICO|nr:TetR/AcrR family transcriptional regulator C-terminal domain-containing protein [Brevibacterium marinum]NJC57274.1 AcrR family transcriptional regulator [Brevibacterium marinum]